MRRQLAEEATPRAEILGGQGFGFAVENEADLELARRVMEWNALPQQQARRCSRESRASKKFGAKCTKASFWARCNSR